MFEIELELPPTSISDLIIEDEDKQEVETVLDILNRSESVTISYVLDDHSDLLMSRFSELETQINSLWHVREKVSVYIHSQILL